MTLQDIAVFFVTLNVITGFFRVSALIAAVLESLKGITRFSVSLKDIAGFSKSLKFIDMFFVTLKVIADILVFPKILPVFSKALGLVISITKTLIIIYGFFETSDTLFSNPPPV